MLKETKIGDTIFVEQTTYYIYASEEDRKNDHYSICTSSKDHCNSYKINAKKSAARKLKLEQQTSDPNIREKERKGELNGTT